MEITSDYGSFDFPHFYLGWRNIHRPTVSPDDCGDEIFGISIGKLYVGYYEDGKWCAGVLDANGCLN
jgi:hypothetical protein